MNERTRALVMEWIIRIALALVFLYIGSDILMHPKGVLWAVPPWFFKIVTVYVPIEMYLRFQGSLEFLMGVLMLIWFLPRWVVQSIALLMATEFLFILLFSPQFIVTFRDIGDLAAAVVLFILLLPRGGERLM